MSLPDGSAVQRYDRVSMLLHWLIGAAMLAEIAFGFLLDPVSPRGTPLRTVTVNLHKSIGIVLGLLVLARLAWRLGHPPPPWPAAVPPWQRMAAQAGHGAMYVCMIVTPVAGYIASNFSKYGVKFFGLALPPWAAENAAIYAFFNGLHDAAAYALCLLIAGHLALAAKHAWLDHDGLFSRMWFGPARDAR